MPIDIEALREVFQMREPHEREPHHWLGIIHLVGTILEIHCKGPPRPELGCLYNRQPETCKKCQRQARCFLTGAICATVLDIEGWAMEDFFELRLPALLRRRNASANSE